MNPQVPPYASTELESGNSRFSNDALHIICCSALCTASFSPKTLQALFLNALPAGPLSLIYRPTLTHNPGLASVTVAEIRDVFLSMRNCRHPIYIWWAASGDRFEDWRQIDPVVQPLLAGGLELLYARDTTTPHVSWN